MFLVDIYTPTHKEWKREVYEDGKEIASSEIGLLDEDRKLPVDRFVSRRRANGVQRDVFEYWIRDGGAAHRSMIEGATKGREISLLMWVALTWAAAVGSGDPRHVRAGTQTVKVRTVEGVMSYAAKYMSKQDESSTGPVGRWWGIFNRSLIPWGEVVNLEVTTAQAHRLRRVALRFVNSQRRAAGRYKLRVTGDVGMKLFCRADEWLRNLPQLVTGGG